MDIHKPKPVHSWREFFSEITVIVIGIAIALGGEQLVEAVHWHYKVQATEASINTELGDDLRWALLVKQYGRCAKLYLNSFQTAVIADDTPTVRKLIDIHDKPFPPAPWSYGTYTAALGSQVEDHLPEGRMAVYSREFTWVPLQMEFQKNMYDELATAMTAGLGLPRTPDTVDRHLAAIQRLQSDENGRLDVAEAMLDYARENLSITPTRPALIASKGAQAKDCEARVLAIQKAAKR